MCWDQTRAGILRPDVVVEPESRSRTKIESSKLALRHEMRTEMSLDISYEHASDRVRAACLISVLEWSLR